VTPDHNEKTPDDLEHGVLTTGSIDTAGIGLVGGATAQVDVDLPHLADEDDDLLGDDDLDTGASPTVRTEGDGDDLDAVDAELVDDEPAPAAPSHAAPSAAASVVTGPQPATRREAHQLDEQDAKHAVERVHPRTADVPLQSRRLGEFEAGRESSDLLTADRLLDPAHVVRPEPEGGWQHFVYTVSARRINLGDSKRARARKELDRRIAAPLGGGAKFVPVLSRKGGVGKTTVSTLLGMALADARDDRVIAIDANPDRGTLADRVGRSSGKTVRDLVRVRGEVVGFNDLSAIVARDDTRLDVLASDADPRVSEAFNDRDYHDVASVAAHYYSIVLTDTGTGIVHSVMEATLEVADVLVIVAGLSVDEARLASETLTWLETNGFEDQVRNAVVVLNTARPGTPLVRASELDAHFRTRVRSVVRMPYDPHLAAGSTVSFRDLQPATRLAARELAATVIEGLRILTAV
jgi:MinD-like ATPase involved in chromosome partitioning or flagellar assembly